MDLVSQASPIPFRSADRFQYRHAEEGSGDLGPLFVDLYGNLNRANEIAEHIIIAFITRDWLDKNVQEVVLAAIVEARRKLEYDLRGWQQKVVVNFVKSRFTTS